MKKIRFYLIKMSISSFYNCSINLIALVTNKFMARITHIRKRCACAQVLSGTKLARYRVEHVARNFIFALPTCIFFLLPVTC